MDLYGKIKDMVQSLLPGDSLFLVDLVLSDPQAPRKVTLFIDGDRGATVDDCANLSRALGKALDDLDLLPEKYTLEVSTPGVDHPLKFRRQYPKHIGRQLRVTLADKSQHTGRLVKVGDEHIFLSETAGKSGKQTGETAIPFESIEKAFVMISFK